MLQNTASPRIIFIGGSNLSFGLNSKMIYDSLHINPINTGIHASIGLKYMLDNTIQYIKKGDIVILVPEYSQFYRDYNFGSNELLRTIFDVNREKFKLLNMKQIFNLIPYIPKYALSKFKPTEYFFVTESDIYGCNSFNEYGDTYTHWGKEKENFKSFGRITGNFNITAIQEIKNFESEIVKKNATLFISYPGFQDLSYLKSIEQIKKVETAYKNNGFKILGNPERYMMPDNMMFNTPYHLNKNGVDRRSTLFVEDFLKYNLQP